MLDVLGFFIVVMWSETDRKYMSVAMELAGKGAGFVNPNPMVGAVIVKDGRIMGKGFHMRYGGPHAEPNALASCTEDPAGATMYVTLEPCCHYGKRPPCTDAIIAAGISRVVAASGDPNPLVSGKGLSILREHGIEVSCGLMEKEMRMLNRVFFKYITDGKPWISMKAAMTADGHIAAVTGDSKWVTSEQSRHAAHVLRGRHMGIMAGSGTVRADNPMLNCRIEGMKSPIRIIVSSSASLPAGSAILDTAKDYRTIVAHGEEASRENIVLLEKAGVEPMACLSENGKVDVSDMVSKLGKAGIDSILLEGGSELNWSFVEKGLADEYYFFIAPKIIGGRTAKTPVGGEGFPLMRDAGELVFESVRKIGDDILIHAFSKKNGHLLPEAGRSGHE